MCVKDVWDTLKVMRLGNECARKVKEQQMCCEYEALEFRDGEALEDFTIHLTDIIMQMGELGEPVTKEFAVRKFLCTMLEHYD
jgi:hypothetical protein